MQRGYYSIVCFDVIEKEEINDWFCIRIHQKHRLIV